MTKIRIGLLVNDLTIPYWLAESIKDILRSDYAEIAVIVKRNQGPSGQPRIEFYSTLLNSLPLIVATKLDQYIFKTPHDALARTEISSILPDCPIIEVDTVETKHTDRLTQDAIEKIKTYDLDLLLRSGFKILKGDILTKSSRFGVWSFHHGNNRYYRGTPACFWEVYQNTPTSGYVLQQLSEVLDGGMIIAKGEVPTANYSLHKTRQAVYWDAQGMLNLTLQKAHKIGLDNFTSKLKKNREISVYDRPLYYSPTFVQSLLYLVKIVFRWIAIKIKKYLFKNVNDWYIGWMNRDEMYSFRKIKKVYPPKKHFWADPFIVTYKNEELLFLEEFEYAKNKGRIIYLKFDKANKRFHSPKSVLETDYHLSFPFTIVDDNELYVIPETKSNNAISLYQWIDEKLVFKCNLIANIKAVDTNILFKDNKYWLFTSQQVSQYGTIFHQHIYYADCLEGPYLPHEMNPISSSNRISRAAGGILKIGDYFYRTSQDCSETYGKKVYLFKIEELTTETYKEVWVETIEAEWDNKINKIHTLNQSENLIVVDLYGKIKR
jgi:hypothetical protein